MKPLFAKINGRLEKRLGICFLISIYLFINLSDCLYAQKAAQSSIETKIALESNLENRLKKVLTEITGTEKLVVIVNVTLQSEKKEKKPEKKKEEILLPGVPIKETLAGKQVESVMMSALGDETRTMIKKLSVTIILDKGISDDVVKIVDQVARGLLGIDIERGDELLIKPMRFQKNIFYWGSIIYPPHIYWVLAILSGIGFAMIISLFLFGPFKKFSKDFATAAITSAATFKEKAAEASEGALAGTPIPELTQETGTRTGTVKTATGREPLFSFVNESNIKEFIYLLKNESANHIAAAVNYLDPGLSSRVLSEISPDKKKEVIALLSKTAELDSSAVEQIENHLKSRIDFLSGGEEKIMKIIDTADEKMQMEIISDLKNANPELAEKIEASIVRIEILSTLEVSAIQLIMKQVGLSMFGQILKILPGNQQEKIISTLPAGAATRLKQEMSLGKPITPQRLEIEKKRLLNIIRRMKQRGII
ncbi:MAG: hypothetical protein JW983_02615 [Elusimicrobia bacterium]|nr:hypothetical protein [Elusimicrobiota bacterium]